MRYWICSASVFSARGGRGLCDMGVVVGMVAVVSVTYQKRTPFRAQSKELGESAFQPVNAASTPDAMAGGIEVEEGRSIWAKERSLLREQLGRQRRRGGASPKMRIARQGDPHATAECRPQNLTFYRPSRLAFGFLSSHLIPLLVAPCGRLQCRPTF